MIKFDNVSKIYPGDFIALEGVSFVIEDGEFVCFVGHSGSGKSTVFKLVTGEEQVTEGEVYFNERTVSSIKRRLLPYFRRNFGTVFQDFKLLPQKTAFENVAYALEVAGYSDEEVGEKVPEILDLVGMSDKAEKYPRQLSGGEQQKISIARALVHNPKVILADEPSGNLDPVSTWEIMQLLLKINSLGTTVLLATHNRDTVDKLKKRVIALDNGKVIRDDQRGRYVI